MLSSFVQGQPDRHYVTCMCRSAREKCVYSSSATECYMLKNCKRSPVTRLTPAQGEIVTRGTPGDTYYWEGNELTPSINCPILLKSLNVETARGYRFNPSIPIYFSRTTQLQPPNDCGWQYLYRLFIALNGRIPGPDLVVTEGQIVVVKVTNKLTSEGITIHWHGIHQRKSPRMDGVT